MLSEKVNVTLFGILSEKSGLYSGYCNSDKIMNKSAYIITHSKINETFTGVVIALAKFSGNEDEKLIVAPEGEIFYEPEIRKILELIKNASIESVKCLYEKSCGAVIFYKGKQSVNILLVKNNNGRYWSFPKGHIEKGETEKETAIREIKEETNLDVEICGDFHEISEYCPFGKIRKRVVFFLARAFTDNVKVQETEIDSYIWVDFQQARKICSYDNDLRVIDKAETAIHLLK